MGGAVEKKKNNYVNNKDLLQALIDYKQLCDECEECGDPQPKIPNYIGECIMLIAQRLATKPNFSGYTYKDDMISDGIENCLQYIGNFDPEKSNNPFAYFTQIIWYAFLRRIQKEKKQTYIRFKMSQNAISDSIIRDSTETPVIMNEPPEYVNEFVEQFEKKISENKSE